MAVFELNSSRCIKCGNCIANCVTHCLVADEDGFPMMTNERCIDCRHCLTICPTAAVTINGASPEASRPLVGNLPTVEALETLIKGRRSVRRFKAGEVAKETIDELFQTVWHAPTGTNAQAVHFTVTSSREATDRLRALVYDALDGFLGARDRADDSYGLKIARMFHRLYRGKGIDGLMHGAPHVVIATAPRTVAVPQVDCAIALTNFELLAATAGLGAVWNGILTWCLAEWIPEVRAELGLPEDHAIGYCMSFGVPVLKHHRTVQRGPAKLTLI